MRPRRPSPLDCNRTSTIFIELASNAGDLDKFACVVHTTATLMTARCGMADLLILHGPNLNLLGTREPEQYGTTTLADIDRALEKRCESAGISVESFQSNAEHALVERVQQAAVEGVRFILINPAALTHTSVALRDALLATGIPFIEVHLSNVYARESFRRHSYFSDVAVGVISGLGAQGYELALDAALARLANTTG